MFLIYVIWRPMKRRMFTLPSKLGLVLTWTPTPALRCLSLRVQNNRAPILESLFHNICSRRKDNISWVEFFPIRIEISASFGDPETTTEI